MTPSNAGNAVDGARDLPFSAKFLDLLISTTYGNKSIGRRAAPKPFIQVQILVPVLASK